MEFDYVMPSVVVRVAPVLGPLDGGTLVRVHGEGFVQGVGLMCRFGDLAVDTPVAARWLSSTLLECRSRGRITAGNVSLEVSSNTQDFSSSGVLFEYLGNPVVGLLRPAQGPIGGGTLVEVQGGPFWARVASLGMLYCQFG
jgi:hypothetical protein